MAQITYNGKTLAELTEGKTATLHCAGEAMSTDVIVTGPCSVEYNGKTIAELTEGQTATLHCTGKRMVSDVRVTFGASGSGESGGGGDTGGGEIGGGESGGGESGGGTGAIVLQAHGFNSAYNLTPNVYDVTSGTSVRVKLDTVLNGYPLEDGHTYKVYAYDGENYYVIHAVSSPDENAGSALSTSNASPTAVKPQDGKVYIAYGMGQGKNGYYFKVVKPLITFTIAGTTYQAESGMTWGEWVDSDYNTAGWYIADERVYRSSGSGYVYYSVDNTVHGKLLDEGIMENFAYGTWAVGGGSN